MNAAVGFANAWDEITLVLFTTLAPSGVAALIIMALVFVVRGPALDTALRVAIDRFLWVPILVTMVGLVASATHLGNPANALYVLAGVGRSPLSNEVASGVVFLGSAGVYWLTAFSADGGRPRLRRAALVAICALGVVFVTAIAFAYDAETIESWHLPVVPLSLWANALLGGPLLALVGLAAAGYRSRDGRLERGLVAVAVLAWAANVALYLLWGASLPQIENALGAASDLAPAFMPLVGVFAVLAAAGVALAGAVAARVPALTALPPWRLAAAFALVAAGLFVMRFAFYMTRMTVGL